MCKPKECMYKPKECMCKPKECMCKPKDLWKAIKSFRLPNKSGGCIVGALTDNQIVKHDTKIILKTFKFFYSKLVGNLLVKLPKAPNRYIQLNLSLIITFII